MKFSVPQGSVLGPVVFSIFINDLPLHVKSISVDCEVLADDTTLHTSGEEEKITNQKQYARQPRSGVTITIFV